MVWPVCVIMAAKNYLYSAKRAKDYTLGNGKAIKQDAGQDGGTMWACVHQQTPQPVAKSLTSLMDCLMDCTHSA